MAAGTKVDPHLKRLFDNAIKSTRENWGRGWDKLSTDLQLALMSEAVLILADAQHTDDANVVRRIVNEGRDYVLDVAYGAGA